MRLGALAFAALLVLTITSQTALMRTTEAETTDLAITACAVQGGNCLDASLDGTPVSTILSHAVFEGGCSSSDLHVMRYLSDENLTPIVATWCT
jgi:hypothetical protein